jgi:hypothetical protein
MMTRMFIVVFLGLTLSACGTQLLSRIDSGFVIGAAAGGTAGLLGGPLGAIPLALAGGATGALVGAVTTPDQVDLNRLGVVTLP